MLISMWEVVGNLQGRPQWSLHLLLMALYISLHMNNFPLTNNRQCWWDAISMIRLKLWLQIASRFFLLLLCLRSGLPLWRYQYGKELKRSLVKSQWEYEDLTLTTCGEFKATNNSEGAWKWIFPPGKSSDESADPDAGLVRGHETEGPSKTIPYPQKPYNDECTLP